MSQEDDQGNDNVHNDNETENELLFEEEGELNAEDPADQPAKDSSGDRPSESAKSRRGKVYYPDRYNGNPEVPLKSWLARTEYCLEQDGIDKRKWGTEILVAHCTFDVERLVRSKLRIDQDEAFDPDVFTYAAVKSALQTLHMQVDKPDEAIYDEITKSRVDPKTGHRGLLLEWRRNACCCMSIAQMKSSGGSSTGVS